MLSLWRGGEVVEGQRSERYLHHPAQNSSKFSTVEQASRIANQVRAHKANKQKKQSESSSILSRHPVIEPIYVLMALETYNRDHLKPALASAALALEQVG